MGTTFTAESTRQSRALNLSPSWNATRKRTEAEWSKLSTRPEPRLDREPVIEIPWNLTPKGFRLPEGKRPMLSRIVRSDSFRSLKPGLRETLRVLLSIADAPMIGREGMVHGFATLEAIAGRRGCSTRQVKRDLARLEGLGWIAKARREPVRFNLGIVFTVFDAPIGAPVRLVGAPKGPNARAGLVALAEAMSPPPPQAETRVSRPQAGTRMSPPNRERQWDREPSTTAPQAAGRGGSLGSAQGSPEPPNPVRVCLSEIRSPTGEAIAGPEVERLTESLTTAGVPVSRIRATWASIRSGGARRPLAVLVARLRAGEIASEPQRESAPVRNCEPDEVLRRDALSPAEHRDGYRAIREALREPVHTP